MGTVIFYNFNSSHERIFLLFASKYCSGHLLWLKITILISRQVLTVYCVYCTMGWKKFWININCYSGEERRFMYQNRLSKSYQLPFDQGVQIHYIQPKLSGLCTRTDQRAIWQYFASITLMFVMTSSEYPLWVVHLTAKSQKHVSISDTPCY